MNISQLTLRFGFLLYLISILITGCSEDSHHFVPVNLKCEYMVDPLGIDTPEPRFTWQVEDNRMGASQSAFRILVGTDSVLVAGGTGNIWTSTKVNSGSNLFEYGGEPLKPFTKYFWSVKIWDNKGNLSPVARVASFETGVKDVSNWKGSWISDSRDINLKPAPCFRKLFTVPGEILSARIYIAAAGLYELSINGEAAGNDKLTPSYTRFDRRILYNTYNVTDLMKRGENVVGVLLGNGWYNHQSTAVWYFDEAPWRARPKFCLDLHITLSDSTKMIISSGTDWKTILSPVIFNSIYTGEHYDARLELKDWNKPGYDDMKWSNSIPVAAPSQKIVSEVMHPVRISEEIPSGTVKQLDQYTWLFDLGRNIAGVSSLYVRGSEGTVIRMKHAERLDKNGRADQSNIDVHYRPKDDSDPFQTDIFILSGKGEESFMPRFNYKGFQYVEVSFDKPLNLTAESLTGHFMHSDVPSAGKIESSNDILNSIWKATNNSYLSNLFGYPTDCPQREKNGWTGDAHIAVETGLYNFDAVTVYEKWLNDHLDEQQPNGVLPAIVPTGGWGYTWANGPDWTSTIAIIPWNIYLFYGDSRLLKTCYAGIKKYVDHISEISPSGLTDWGLGDWIPVKSVSPKELTSSVYYFVDATILSKAAKLFGNQADYEKYSSLAVKIRDAVNKKYLDKETGIYGKGFQTELCVPLYWGLVPAELKDKVAENLARSVEANGNHMDVGLLGTKAILNALSENGYSDIAYRLAAQESFPSWGWWIKNGATTLYENWPVDSDKDISLNHIMFGEIGAWMYKALGGIFPDEEEPGFKNIILKPHFVDGLDSFYAEHDGPYGKIISSWEKKNKNVLYKVSIPANSTANLYLEGKDLLENDREPGKNRYVKILEYTDGNYSLHLQSGEYSFSINTDSFND